MTFQEKPDYVLNHGDNTLIKAIIQEESKEKEKEFYLKIKLDHNLRDITSYYHEYHETAQTLSKILDLREKYKFKKHCNCT